MARNTRDQRFTFKIIRSNKIECVCMCVYVYTGKNKTLTKQNPMSELSHLSNHKGRAVTYQRAPL